MTNDIAHTAERILRARGGSSGTAVKDRGTVEYSPRTRR